MSRIGKKTTLIPNGVTVSAVNGVLTVQGPKATLTRPIHPLVTITVADGAVNVSVQKETVKFERSLWGTFSAHIANMVVGVTTGYKKQLEINGVGYRVAMQGTDLKIDVGFSHPVVYKIPAGITASVEKNVITIEGSDKDLVGQVAAEIRAIRKPEPYKGKGIKHMDEQIRRKAGKTAKA